jgi:hypothetical protein
MDSTLWQEMGGANAAAFIQFLGGKYLKAPLSDPRLKAHLPRGGSCFYTYPANLAGSVAKGQVTTRDGIRVLLLKDSRGDVTYVTDTAKPEIVEQDDPPLPGMKEPAGESTIRVGAPVKLAAPPASQVIDASQVGL